MKTFSIKEVFSALIKVFGKAFELLVILGRNVGGSGGNNGRVVFECLEGEAGLMVHDKR